MESQSGMCAKLRTVAASNKRDHAPQSLYYCLFAPHVCGVVLRHIPFVVNRTFNAMPAERLQQHLLLFTTNRTEGFTQNDLHILVTTSFCCDRKARAACALSFALWQQATEIMSRNYSIIACSRHLYSGVDLRAHSVRGEPHIQRNASGEVATVIAGHCTYNSAVR